MAVRAATLVRAAVVGGIALIAAVSLVRPRDPAAGRPRAPRAETRGEPAPPQVVDHPTPEGLVAVNAAGLLARVRRSRARGIVVNAWASWCGSCKEDIPLLLSLPGKLGEGIEVMLVSVDEAESVPAAAEMLRAFHAPAPAYVVAEPLEQFKPAINPRWPGMLPATFLFDQTGKLRYFWGGPVLESDVTPILTRYLAGEHVDGEANFALAPGAVTR